MVSDLKFILIISFEHGIDRKRIIIYYRNMLLFLIVEVVFGLKHENIENY